MFTTVLIIFLLNLTALFFLMYFLYLLGKLVFPLNLGVLSGLTRRLKLRRIRYIDMVWRWVCLDIDQGWENCSPSWGLIKAQLI